MRLDPPPARRIRLSGPAAAMAALALGGCANGVTYGTGTPTGMQTLTDVTGMVSLRGEQRDPIDYRPRAGIVAPPGSTLPPPGSSEVANAEWPRDPDEIARRQRAANARLEATMTEQELAQLDPGFRLPSTAEPAPNEERGNPDFASDRETMQRLAAIRGEKGGSLDETGQPTRRYLTDPPTEIRQPDPSVPIEEPEKRRGKFRLSNLWPF